MDGSDIIEFPKDLAATELARTSESRRTLIEDHSASYRWLIASFLAINSGGLLILEDTQPRDVIWLGIGAFFYLGIAFAFSIAWLNQRTTRAMLAQVAELEAVWASAASTGMLDCAKRDQLVQNIGAVGNGPGRWFGWLSFLAFSAGVTLMGVHGYGNPPAETKPIVSPR